jgi:protein SCO1/2
MLLTAAPLLALAHDHHQHAAAAAPSTARSFEIPDVEVVTQNGQRLHFYSDLVAGRLVAVNFIFTSCTTVCPVMGARTAALQSLLGSRASAVTIISISIDPKNDTPELLLAWSRRFKARPGWTLVTGEKGEIERLVRAFGIATADPASHVPLLLIGDPHGGWERVDGLAEPSKLAALLEARMPGRAAP